MKIANCLVWMCFMIMVFAVVGERTATAIARISANSIARVSAAADVYEGEGEGEGEGVPVPEVGPPVRDPGPTLGRYDTYSNMLIVSARVRGAIFLNTDGSEAFRVVRPGL